ncbi:MAG: hypothetical protein JWN89_440 [Parcubacteria group bacterium]|nr:hypothetical protein [Parcubacteria group bacterium]
MAAKEPSQSPHEARDQPAEVRGQAAAYAQIHGLLLQYDREPEKGEPQGEDDGRKTNESIHRTSLKGQSEAGCFTVWEYYSIRSTNLSSYEIGRGRR